MKQQKPGEKIWIKGPVGLGLGLTKKSFGNFVGFSAGTGINAFLDLLHFFAHKKICKTYGNDLYSDDEIEFYNRTLNDFNLVRDNSTD